MYKRKVETKVVYSDGRDKSEQFRNLVDNVYPSEGWKKIFERSTFMESGYAILMRETGSDR